MIAELRIVLSDFLLGIDNTVLLGNGGRINWSACVTTVIVNELLLIFMIILKVFLSRRGFFLFLVCANLIVKCDY